MKKKIIKEKMGGGNRIDLGGVNSDGPYYDRYGFKHPTGYHTGGYRGNADSIHSRRMNLKSDSEMEEDIEYKEDQNMLEEEELMEFFARIMKMPLTEEEKKNIIKSDAEEEEEDVSEISAGGVAGVMTPLGTNAKGKVPSDKERKDRIKAANIYKN